MNPEKLYVKKFKGLGEWEYKDSEIFYCSSCKIVHSSFEKADKCCQNNVCECGKVCERKYYLTCDSCSRKLQKEKEKEKFKKAEKIDIKDYKGYILDGEYAHDDWGMYFDGFFGNECDFVCPLCEGETESKDCVGENNVNSYLSCKSCAWNSPSFETIDEICYLFAPEYIWATDFKPLKLDLSDILENATEKHHETVNDYLKGREDLQLAIDKFNELNKDVGTYWESDKLALVNIKEYVKKLYNK